MTTFGYNLHIKTSKQRCCNTSRSFYEFQNRCHSCQPIDKNFHLDSQSQARGLFRFRNSFSVECWFIFDQLQSDILSTEDRVHLFQNNSGVFRRVKAGNFEFLGLIIKLFCSHSDNFIFYHNYNNSVTTSSAEICELSVVNNSVFCNRCGYRSFEVKDVNKKLFTKAVCYYFVDAF